MKRSPMPPRTKPMKRTGFKSKPCEWKRSAIKRKDKPKKPAKKKKRLRHNTPERAAENKITNQLRREFWESFDLCMVCRSNPPSVTHEIAGGPVRKLAVWSRACQLATCEKCHNEIHAQPKRWPKARQLAVVYSRNNKDFDLAEFLRVWGRAKTAITMAEIEKYLGEAT